MGYYVGVGILLEFFCVYETSKVEFVLLMYQLPIFHGDLCAF